jgi:hypothetical protein
MAVRSQSVFQASPDEIQKLLKVFDSPDAAYAEGVKINGEKYTLIQVMDGVVRTKKVRLFDLMMGEV